MTNPVDHYYHGNLEQALLDLIQKELKRLQTKERLQAIIGLLKNVSEQDMKKFEDSVKRRPFFGGRSVAL